VAVEAAETLMQLFQKMAVLEAEDRDGYLPNRQHLEGRLVWQELLDKVMLGAGESSTKLWDQLHSLVLWRAAVVVLAAQVHTIFLAHMDMVLGVVSHHLVGQEVA
jgi:hypothetical protein